MEMQALGLTRKESSRDSRKLSEMHATKGNGTSLQSATANCRLQRKQNFITNSILSMLLTTQERATHPYHYQDLKATVIIVHSDTVKLGDVASHSPPQRGTTMAKVPLLILPLCLLQRFLERRLIIRNLSLASYFV